MLDALQQMDLSMLLWIQNHLRSNFMTGFWKAVTFLGDGGWFWIVLGIAFLIYRKTRFVGVSVMLSLVIEALITNVCIKNWVARMRPYDYSSEIVLLISKQADFSFPSGHSGASFAAAYICIRMLPKKYGVPLFILAILIAFSRLYVGVHYPLDVLGGILIGLGSGMATEALVKRIKISGRKP